MCVYTHTQIYTHRYIYRNTDKFSVIVGKLKHHQNFKSNNDSYNIGFLKIVEEIHIFWKFVEQYLPAFS